MELGLRVFEYQKLQTWGIVVFNNDPPDFKTCPVTLCCKHAHTHSLVVDHMTGTSHHQDLDLVLLVRPVEERDAGVVPEERRRSRRPLGVLDLLEQLHDLLGRAVLFGPRGLGVGGGKHVRRGSLGGHGGLGQRDDLHGFCRKGEIYKIKAMFLKFAIAICKLKVQLRFACFN